MSDHPHPKLKEYVPNAAWVAGGVDIVFADDGPGMVRNIYIVTAGTGKLRVVFGDGTTEDITALEDGTCLEPSPTHFQRIKAHANTDCDLIRVGW